MICILDLEDYNKAVELFFKLPFHALHVHICYCSSTKWMMPCWQQQKLGKDGASINDKNFHRLPVSLAHKKTSLLHTEGSGSFTHN